LAPPGGGAGDPIILGARKRALEERLGLQASAVPSGQASNAAVLRAAIDRLDARQMDQVTAALDRLGTASTQQRESQTKALVGALFGPREQRELVEAVELFKERLAQLPSAEAKSASSKLAAGTAGSGSAGATTGSASMSSGATAGTAAASPQ
jgi:hypothetical protein